MLKGARWPLVCAHPGVWIAGLLLVLQAGLDWALQASRGRAGHRAGCWAASQAAGQRVAGRGAASTRAPEQFRAEARVAACVLGQVVAAGEALGAERTGKALLPSVRPVVAGQLVGARKLLVAAWPVAGKGALAWTEEAEDKEKAVVSGAEVGGQGEGKVPLDPMHPRHLSHLPPSF